MAFVDSLLDHGPADAHITIVDRHPKPGGHWNTSYPFVTLHQPSVTYGLSQLTLNDGVIDQAGPNAGFGELASGAQVQAYYDHAMRHKFLPGGRVRYLPMTDYEGGAERHTPDTHDPVGPCARDCGAQAGRRAQIRGAGADDNQAQMAGRRRARDDTGRTGHAGLWRRDGAGTFRHHGRRQDRLRCGRMAVADGRSGATDQLGAAARYVVLQPRIDPDRRRSHGAVHRFPALADARGGCGSVGCGNLPHDGGGRPHAADRPRERADQVPLPDHLAGRSRPAGDYRGCASASDG